MFNLIFIMGFFLSLFIFILFFFVSKIFKFDNMLSSIFECGFFSYFYSRFSFSIHYFIVALIFLFLDLELCFIMPLFNEFMLYLTFLLALTVLLILLLGLLWEWKQGKLDWIF